MTKKVNSAEQNAGEMAAVAGKAWFETNAKGEKRKRRKRGFDTKREALEYERQKKLF